MRGATVTQLHCGHFYGNFNPHSPCGERPGIAIGVDGLPAISIHTPHAGSDEYNNNYDPTTVEFQSTLPMRGATVSIDNFTYKYRKFQSTLPMRGATGNDAESVYQPSISIHTPHAGSDSRLAVLYGLFVSISIHTPHAGSDLSYTTIVPGRDDFNPHSPCGERRFSL